MIIKPLTGRRGGIYWDILQTFSAAEIAFDRFARLVHGTELVRKKPNESDLCFFLQNNANLFFKSGDKPQNLRAETLDGCIIDECRQQKKEIWSQIVFPMLGRFDGWCDFYSTPNGFDWFYDLYTMARDKNPDGEWATFHAPSTECWWWTEKQIAQAKSTMSDEEYAQEILAEFRNLVSGSVYVNFSKENIRPTSPLSSTGEVYSPYLRVIVACDWNLTPMSWALMQQRGQDFYAFDEIFLKDSHTQEASKELIGRLKALDLKTKPQIVIAGDATAKAGQRAAAGQSDYTILCAALDEAGVSWTNATPDSNPHVKDRINTMNAKLRAADGTNHLWIHPRCTALIKDFERVVFKAGSAGITLDQTTDPMLTHMSDAVGYAVSALDPLRPNGDVGRLLVLRR